MPRPLPPPGGVLVRTTHSVISIGTEKMKVEQAKMNLLQKAKARPDQVRKVIDTARNIGWKSAYEKVRNRLSSPTPLGYSAAGIVEAVDDGNSRFRVGDRVACGGAECAFHAEYIAVPDMLAAKVPDGVPMWQAAYTTLLSIAMQAVRQTEPRLPAGHPGSRVVTLEAIMEALELLDRELLHLVRLQFATAFQFSVGEERAVLHLESSGDRQDRTGRICRFLGEQKPDRRRHLG